MRARTWFASAAATAALSFASCDVPHEPTGPEPSLNRSGVSATANGGGEFLITLLGGFPGQFAMSNVQVDPATGAATGRFHLSLDFIDGLIEFHGRTTCLTVDGENGRAWIGGVVTQNNSVDADWRQDRHLPGRDIWFRVVDYGQGADAQGDRMTFAGFEGDAGIITSAEYCEAMIWPDNDERTWPVTNGNIQVTVND